MAAVPITIIGTATDSDGSKNITIVGLASHTGLGVGGGPIEPPEGGEGGEPPSIWPGDEHPEHPIYLPPGIWPDPPEGSAPHPEHPIVIPPPDGIDGPELEVKTIWTPEQGWAVVLVPTGEHPAPASGGQRPGQSAGQPRPPGPSQQPVPPPRPGQAPPRPQQQPQPTPQGRGRR